ncbi:orotate phosphoribosyltransferase [Flammeovirgaceae bacterium SG7u.111]|nr:orotate phosphoribosyltransferase [Flammeovirgaceae bacterium SG7u.132]WPO35385.1 orotate phosphoribosyltransferase [Flammeovirgaceae bacterium SG7u.111]
MKDISAKVAEMLLETGAVVIRPEDPFTWTSGWKSPIYCDNRLTLSFPEVRSYIKKALTATIRNKYPDVEVIAGVATAGIPQAALVADFMELPLMYVRSKPKGHGMENMIEGTAKAGAKVVLIEDLISTGGSSVKAAVALKEAGYDVLGLGAIFSYGFDVSSENFAQAEVDFFSLSNYQDLVKNLVDMGKMEESVAASLGEWRKSPSTWKQ